MALDRDPYMTDAQRAYFDEQKPDASGSEFLDYLLQGMKISKTQRKRIEANLEELTKQVKASRNDLRGPVLILESGTEVPVLPGDQGKQPDLKPSAAVPVSDSGTNPGARLVQRDSKPIFGADDDDGE